MTEKTKRRTIERVKIEAPPTGQLPERRARPERYLSGAKCAECGYGIECIDVVQHLNFNRGNVIKYVWRAGKKDPSKTIEDLEKARQYIDFEIARLRSSLPEKIRAKGAALIETWRVKEEA